MARTIQQNQAMRDRSREKILSAALGLFAQQGFSAATIREVAASAGVSQGLLYTHFLGKDELLREIFRRNMEDVRASFEAASAPAHPPEPPARMRQASGGRPASDNSRTTPLELLVRSALGILKRNIDFWRLSYGIRMQPGVAEALGPDLSAWTREILATLEGHFRATGSRRPAVDAALFFAAFDGLCQHFVLDPRHYPLEEVASSLIDKFTIHPPPGGTHGRSRHVSRRR